MKKNVIAIVNEIENEVDRRYALSGHKPNGFGDTMYDHKLAILSDMYEADEAQGMTKEKEKAYAQIADTYTASNSWN